MIWFLLAVIVTLGGLSQYYRMQRDDLGAWFLYLHPEDFPDEASDEPIDRDDDLIGG